MRSFVGAMIALVVTAALGLGAIAVLQNGGKQLPPVSAVNSSSPIAQFAGMKQASMSIETFPFNPYEDQDFIDKNVTGKTLDGEPYPSAPGDNQDWVTYWPTTAFVVPAHALVTVKIYNYDGSAPLLNNYYASPHGTLDPATGAKDVMSVNGTVNGNQLNNQELTTQDPTLVAHTFTIHSIPNSAQPWLFVSVPVSAEDDDAPADDAGMPNDPVVTTFSFITGDPGTYIWQCVAPCGSNFNGFGGPMGTKGYMSGTITVQ